MEIQNEWSWVKIPDGEWAAVAQYTDHKLPEYNSNPMIQALPPILSRGRKYRVRATKCSLR